MTMKPNSATRAHRANALDVRDRRPRADSPGLMGYGGSWIPTEMETETVTSLSAAASSAYATVANPPASRSASSQSACARARRSWPRVVTSTPIGSPSISAMKAHNGDSGQIER